MKVLFSILLATAILGSSFGAASKNAARVPHLAEPAHTILEDDDRCPENCEYRPVECECSVFFQCTEGVYHEYRCAEGLHFNKESGQCDFPANAGCELNPADCCECKYFGTGSCSAEFIFQDHNREVEYEGDHHCIRIKHNCSDGLVWNSALGRDGNCDFKSNVGECEGHNKL